MRFCVKEQKRAAIANIFANLKQFNSYISCSANDEGISLKGFDNSNICMYNCFIDKLWFDEYSSEIDIKYTMPSSILSKIMSMYAGEQYIVVETDAEENINISFRGDTSICDKEFEIPLLSIDYDNVNVSNMESDVEFTIKSKDFHELVTQLAIFNDTMTMYFDEEQIKITTIGEHGSMTAKLEDYEYAISEDTTIQQSFSLKHIYMMCNFWKLSETVRLDLGENRPLSFHYSFGKKDDDKDIDEAYIKIYLAPKIDDDD